MAFSMNLRDLTSPQYSAVTGRNKKTPYTAYLTAMGPYAREMARQDQLDTIRSNELAQSTAQFNAGQVLERERLDAEMEQAEKASTINLVNTGLTAAALANQAGIINLKDVAGGVIKGGKYLYNAATGAGAAAEAASAAAAGAAAADAGSLAGAAATGVMSVPGLAGAITAGQYAAPAYLAREALGGIFRASGNPVLESQGELMREPTIEGLIGATINDVFNMGREGEIAAQWADPVGASMKWATERVGCIIVTACTSPESEEVNITREYRDKYLTPEQLRGYYMIAEKVVPAIAGSAAVKWFVKRFLVDNLIAYGRHALGKGPRPGLSSTLITRGFLALCNAVGSRKPSFVRVNGEIV